MSQQTYQINMAIPRLEKAFKYISEKKVVLLEYGRAVVHGTKPYRVNYTMEKCTCEDFKYRNVKCAHIWAAEFEHKKQVEMRQ